MPKTIGTGYRRSFSLTVGTKPGYSEFAVARDVRHVRAVIERWLAERLRAGRFILSGVLTEGVVVYGYADGFGRVATKDEPVCVYSGEVSVLYCQDVKDEDVMAALDELADRLAADLGQTRVYLAFDTTAWVREREGGESSPSGEPK